MAKAVAKVVLQEAALQAQAWAQRAATWAAMAAMLLRVHQEAELQEAELLAVVLQEAELLAVALQAAELLAVALQALAWAQKAATWEGMEAMLLRVHQAAMEAEVWVGDLVTAAVMKAEIHQILHQLKNRPQSQKKSQSFL